ncbi:unnamed protein product, partial [marine sediment metagenome]
GETEFALNIKKTINNSIVAEINIKIQNLLGRNFPVCLIWSDEQRSNPIFPCNLEELSKSIEVDEDEYLTNVGDFELEDKELESLLHELDNSLVIDRQSISSIWQATGDGSQTLANDNTGIMIDYSKIDYGMLRTHPKLAQYRDWRPGGREYRKTRLQIILSSITAHFQGLIDTAAGDYIPLATNIPVEELEEDLAQEDVQEVEEQEAEKEKRRTRGKARMRNIMKAFIRRYMRGIKSAEFLKLVDYDVIGNNYVIFSHVLWRMYA